MDPLNFDVTLDSAAGGGIKIPYDVRALFGKAKPPVVVTVRAGREPRAPRSRRPGSAAFMQ
jgi:hypothetical protein